MRIEIDDTELIDSIVEKVVERLEPLLLQNSKSNDSELMTVDEVSKYLNVTKSWVYDKVHTRSIPFQKAGKFTRFRKKHLDIWLSNPYSPELNNYSLKHEGRR
jgi:excisionase family DNA binding protein